MQTVRITRDNWRAEVEARGISLARLAPLTGMSVASIYGYSRGARKPPESWFRRLEEVLRDRAA